MITKHIKMSNSTHHQEKVEIPFYTQNVGKNVKGLSNQHVCEDEGQQELPMRE